MSLVETDILTLFGLGQCYSHSLSVLSRTPPTPPRVFDAGDSLGDAHMADGDVTCESAWPVCCCSP